MRAWWLGLVAIVAACGGDDEAATTGTGGATTSGTSSGAGGVGGDGGTGGLGGTGGTTSAGGGGASPMASSGLMLVGSGDFGGNATGAISVFRLDYATGEASALDSLTTGNLKSFMAVDEPRSLVHVGDEGNGAVTTYQLASDGSLTEVASASSVGNPVHLALNPARTHLFAAHYGPGRTEVFGLDGNGYVAASLDDVATGGQTHSTLVPAGDHLFAASKADDHIAQLSFDGSTLTVNTPVTTAGGSGPRHMAMHPAMPVLYVVNELDRTLDTFAYDAPAGTLSAAQEPIALDLPSAPTNGSGADVHVHPSGEFLYASLRRNNGEPGELVRCDLDSAGLPTAVARTETQGMTPRNFDITEDGRFVVVANQNSDQVVVFATDAEGTLSATDTLNVASKPFFVTVVDE